MSNTCTVPILATDLEGNCTLDYVVHKTEYAPAQASIQVLVNGQAAFGAVHEAIARAKKSVLIICWGFQPSMYFVRNGLIKDENSKVDMVQYPVIGKVPAQIGRLLEYKAEKGVKVRVLCFGATDANHTSPLLKMPLNFCAALFLGEPNLPNYGLSGLGRWSSRPVYQKDAGCDEDKRWFGIWPKANEGNLLFKTRGFGKDRLNIAPNGWEDKGLAFSTKATLIATPSHHQKTVLVDYELPDAAIGFVMGHNTLDHYWDTDAHSHVQHAANAGRNGKTPLHDFSVRVTGPVIAGIFDNFQKAWEKSGGEALPWPIVKFSEYKAHKRNDEDKETLFVPAQILRTQPQYGKEDVKKLYLNALNNTTSFVYVENQYFRWPPFAEKLKTLAASYQKAGRKYSVYLFAVTNSSDGGVGAGTVNTYRMLESLGHAKQIPEVNRLQWLDGVYEKMQKAQRNWKGLGIKTPQDPTNPRNMKIDAAKQAYDTIKEQYEKMAKGQVSVPDQKEPVGLKSLVCTLVAPKTPAGEPWQEVYIHAKMMIVNDAFLTIGSSNINTRSMQVDSEMNIAFTLPDLVQPLRKKLWKMHTNSEGPADFKTKERLNKAYDDWVWLLDDNARREANKESPRCSLRPFLRKSPIRSNSD